MSDENKTKISVTETMVEYVSFSTDGKGETKLEYIKDILDGKVTKAECEKYVKETGEKNRLMEKKTTVSDYFVDSKALKTLTDKARNEAEKEESK